MSEKKKKVPGALRIMWATRPFLPGRLAVYGVYFFATIGFVTTLSYLFSLERSPVLQIVVLAATLGLYFLVRSLLNRQLSHVGDHPHLATMVSYIKGEKIPRRRAQIEHGMTLVSQRFPDGNMPLVMENRITRVMKEIEFNVVDRKTLRAIPGFNKLGRVGDLIMHWALKYMTPVLLGHVMNQQREPTWKALKSGFNFFGQIAQDFTKRLIRFYFFGLFWGLLLIGLFMFLVLKMNITQNLTIPTFVIIIGGIVKAGWVVKRALFEPFAMAQCLSRFIRTSDDLSLDPEMERKLASMSKRYQELDSLAGQERGPSPAAREPLQEQPPASERQATSPASSQPPEAAKEDEDLPSFESNSPSERELAEEYGIEREVFVDQSEPSSREVDLDEGEDEGEDEDEDSLPEMSEEELARFADDLADLDDFFGTDKDEDDKP